MNGDTSGNGVVNQFSAPHDNENLSAVHDRNNEFQNGLPIVRSSPHSSMSSRELKVEHEEMHGNASIELRNNTDGDLDHLREGEEEEDKVEVHGKKDVDEEKDSMFDWRELNTRYLTAMQEKREEEATICVEIEKLFEYYSTWAQVGAQQDEARLTDRLHAQMLCVQRKEKDLERKQQHYEDVMHAFRNALSLLDQA